VWRIQCGLACHSFCKIAGPVCLDEVGCFGEEPLQHLPEPHASDARRIVLSETRDQRHVRVIAQACQPYLAVCVSRASSEPITIAIAAHVLPSISAHFHDGGDLQGEVPSVLDHEAGALILREGRFEALHANVADAITTFVVPNYLMRLTLWVKNSRLQQFAPS
jgi:hypothetical protein